MIKIKNCENINLINIIKSIIKNYECFPYIKDNFNIIVKNLNNLIDYIIFDKNNLFIKLDDFYNFGFNYDFKNYPLIAFNCNCLMFNSFDGVLTVDDDLIINISEFEFKNFERIV